MRSTSLYEQDYTNTILKTGNASPKQNRRGHLRPHIQEAYQLRLTWEWSQQHKGGTHKITDLPASQQMRSPTTIQSIPSPIPSHHTWQSCPRWQWHQSTSTQHKQTHLFSSLPWTQTTSINNNKTSSTKWQWWQWTTARRCQQPTKPSHMSPHQSMSPRHYPNTNRGTTSHNNNLEDKAPLEDTDAEEDMAAEVDMTVVEDSPDMKEDVATQAYQCHTLEAIN